MRPRAAGLPQRFGSCAAYPRRVNQSRVHRFTVSNAAACLNGAISGPPPPPSLSHPTATATNAACESGSGGFRRCVSSSGGGGGFATWLRFASAGDVEDSAAAAPLGWSLGIGVGIIAAA